MRRGGTQPFDRRCQLSAHGVLIQPCLTTAAARDIAHLAGRGIAAEIPMPIRVAREDMAFGGAGAPECRPGRVKAVVAAMGWLMRDKQGGANTATAEDFGDLIRLPPPARINGEVKCPGGACGRCLSQGRHG